MSSSHENLERGWKSSVEHLTFLYRLNPYRQQILYFFTAHLKYHPPNCHLSYGRSLYRLPQSTCQQALASDLHPYSQDFA